MNKKKIFSLLTVMLMMFNILGINKNMWTVTAQDNTDIEISLDEYSEKNSYVEEAIEVDATGEGRHENTISNLKEVTDYVETEVQTTNEELVNLELDNTDDSNLVNRQTSESTDFSYNILGDNTLQIVKYTGLMTDEIIIPQSIDGIIVSEIGNGEYPVFTVNANSDIIIEADNITVNKNAFKNLNISNGSIVFKYNIAEIKNEAFTKLEAQEVIFPEDMLDIPVGEKIFRDAYITHFTVPYNLKTTDRQTIADWNIFKVVTIKEPLDQSVSCSIGHKDRNAVFDLVIQEGVTELTNIGLERMIVDNIYIPSSMESMSDDVFKDIEGIKNVFFNDVESFDEINLNEILNNTLRSEDINVYVPGGIYETLPTLDKGKINEYNVLDLKLFGNGLDDGIIYPSIFEEYIKMGISFNNSDDILDHILRNREDLKQYISDELPYHVKKIEVKIPKYLTGQNEANKIKLNIADISDITDQNSFSYEIIEDENNYIITLRDFRDIINFDISLNVFFNEMIETNEQYSGDFVIEGIIVNSATLEEHVISINESLNNLEYREPDLCISNINYHSLTMDNLLSLNNIYDDVLDFDIEGLLIGGADDELLNKLKVFYDESFLNDDTFVEAGEEKGYAYFDFDFNRYLMEYHDDSIDPAILSNQIKSEGISLLYPDDNDEVNLENTGYELIDAADIKADSTQENEPLKYIVIGDRSIFKNAKKYFSGNQEDLENFRVIPFDGENLKIKDYASELDAVTPLMLFVYGDVEEPPVAAEKTNINVEKVWDDQENASGDRPSSVEIMLVKDGVDTDTVLTLDDTNNWSASFDNLDKTDNGTEIIYTIKEVNVAEGYTPEISGNVLEGFVVINHKEAINQEPDTPDPEVPTPDKPIVKPDKPDEKPINPSEKPSGPSEKPIIEELKPNIPNTAETPQLEVPNTAVDTTYITWFIIMTVSLLLAITNIIKKEKTTY